MRWRYFISSLIAVFLLLSGCSTNNAQEGATPLFKSDRLYLPHETISLYLSHKEKEQKYLRQVNRGHTAGLAIAEVGLGVVLPILIGGVVGVAAVNPQTFSKNDLVGAEVTDVIDQSRIHTPLDEIAKRVSEDIAKLANKKDKEKRYQSPIVIEDNAWKLIYHKLGNDEENNYILVYSATISREYPQASSSGQKGDTRYPVTKEQCLYESSPMPLASWKADDYMRVSQEKETIVQECIGQFRGSYEELLLDK